MVLSFGMTMGVKILAVECVASVAVVVAQLSDHSVALVIGLATLIVTRLFDILDRRQEAARTRKRLEDDAAALKIHTAVQVASIKEAVEENTVLTKEGAAAAKDAYEEANTVNQKIEAIGVKMNDNKPLNQKEK
jgi:hypothetical protein